MKTKIKNLLLLLLLLGLPGVVQAQDAYSTNADGSIYTYSTNADGSANIVAYAGPPWIVTIPTNINGLMVTSIGTNAFYDTSLTSVTIPNSVTSIGQQAFAFCFSLTSATIRNGVTSIGDSAFSGTSITSVSIPASVTSIGQQAFAFCFSLTSATIRNGVTSIGTNAFLDCTSLTSVTIGNSVTNIGDGAFAFSGLTSVTIPNSITSIGEAAFWNCHSLTSMTIPNSVTSIGDYAFAGSGITNVTIPNSVTRIGDEVFYECTSLTSVTIPNSVTSIGDNAFEYCGSLTSVTIGNSVIGELEFAQCYSLTNVTIGNSVTNIGDHAFFACTSLTSVTLGNSVTNIGYIAFYGCTSLTSVYFTGNAPSPTNDSSVFAGDPATVYYLPGTTGWGAMFDGLPTAPWFLPNPQILNFEPGFGIQPGGFGFTISWATNASVVVEAATNLANPVWIPVSINTLTGGTNYFSDPQWTNYPERFYRVTSAFTVGGTLTGLPAGDTVTLQDNGSDNLTLSANGTFTFPTALPNGHAYSVTVSGVYFGGLTPTTCTFTNGSGTISGANVTNVAAQCAWTGTRPPPLTGNPDVDMFNAAVADGTANGGVPGVMYTENGGPFLVTAEGVFSSNVSLRYYPWSRAATTIGNTSCSGTTFPSNTGVIQFGTAKVCGGQDFYGY